MPTAAEERLAEEEAIIEEASDNASEGSIYSLMRPVKKLPKRRRVTRIQSLDGS